MTENKDNSPQESAVDKDEIVQLIENDPMVKQAICKLMSQVFSCNSSQQNDEQDGEVLVDKATSSADKTRLSLAAELLFLVRSEVDIFASWLNSDDSQEIAEARVMACAADFERISMLWDDLGKKHKDIQFPVSEQQQQLLKLIISIYNLTLMNRQAEIVQAEIGSQFDFEQHNDMGSLGRTIQMQIMPGLRNAAGKLHKKPIVKLEK